MNFNLLPQFIIGTPRIVTIQRNMARTIQIRRVTLVETTLKLSSMKESVQWHGAFDRNPANRWLRDILKIIAQDVDGAD